MTTPGESSATPHRACIGADHGQRVSLVVDQQVVQALGAHVDGLIWRLAVEEALGPHTEILESRYAGMMTTPELIALTGPDSQVIDGEFIGSAETRAKPGDDRPCRRQYSLGRPLRGRRCA